MLYYSALPKKAKEFSLRILIFSFCFHIFFKSFVKTLFLIFFLHFNNKNINWLTHRLHLEASPMPSIRVNQKKHSSIFCFLNSNFFFLIYPYSHRLSQKHHFPKLIQVLFFVLLNFIKIHFEK